MLPTRRHCLTCACARVVSRHWKVVFSSWPSKPRSRLRVAAHLVCSFAITAAAAAAAATPPPPPPPLPSTASNEERFRYHLSLELRRHGIEPTPALVETALRTHYANLAANSSASAAGPRAKSASPSPAPAPVPATAPAASPMPKATPAPEFPPEKLHAASPSTASDSTDAPTPPHDPEWHSYINDHGLSEHQTPATALGDKPPAKIKHEPAASPLLPTATDPNIFLTDMDFDPSWPLDMAPSPSPLNLDPLASPHLDQPDFAFSAGDAQPAPPPYNPLPSPQSASASVKLEDTAMEEAGPSPSATTVTPRTAGAAPSTDIAANSAVADVDPTSIDPRLVQMTLAEQIQLQLQVLQELQSQSAEQQGLPVDESPSPDLHGFSMSQPSFFCGSSSKQPRSARKGIPASMSALDVADRPSAEEWKALSSKEKRQLRNKISARNFRERRKEYITQLEDILAQRDATIESIKATNSSLVTENQQLKALLEQHNVNPSSSPADSAARPASATSPSVAAADVATPATPAPAAAAGTVPVPPATSAAPGPAAVAGTSAPSVGSKGQYDVTKILELLRRTQTQGIGAGVGTGAGPTAPTSRMADAPRLSRQSSAQGLDVPSLNLSGLNIPLSSGPSTPLPHSLAAGTSPPPRFAEPMVNTKKDVAYPSSPRTMGRAQSFFAGRSNASSGSFAAPITQVHSMFAPPLPAAPFLAHSHSNSPSLSYAHAHTHLRAHGHHDRLSSRTVPPTSKPDMLTDLVRAFDARCAAARARTVLARSPSCNLVHEHEHGFSHDLEHEDDHVRRLAEQAAAQCLADASVICPADAAAVMQDAHAHANTVNADADDGLPSYAQALRAPVLY